MNDFKFIALVISILFIGCLILFLIALCESKKTKSLKDTVKTVVDAYDYLHDELKRRDAVDKIKSDNRKETNEKINDLYNGNSIDNAINVLRNNKNS